jgi:hypothetical protein
MALAGREDGCREMIDALSHLSTRRRVHHEDENNKIGSVWAVLFRNALPRLIRLGPNAINLQLV